ncbi:MAG: hypothetical protein AAFO93_02840 [Pseudomonadota bacterium]
MNDAEPEILAQITPSQPRRIFATGTLGMLGLLMVWMAVTSGTSAGYQIMLVLLGAGASTLAWVLWQATSDYLVLTPEALQTSKGDVVARVANVRSVDRGAFAFKPSNGFLLTLKTPGRGVWAPGLWWRFGRRVGVGGVTAAHEAKATAEAIMMRINPDV